MRISLTDAGKRFNRDWIFRHLDYEFTQGISYAITGPNGSGKSTLLQVLAGSMLLNEGKGVFFNKQTSLPIQDETMFRNVSLCAPYLELVEEFTLQEFLEFHRTFKPFIPGLSISDIINMVNLEQAKEKQLRYFSSGMKQRVKLAQAFFSDTRVLLLDEPCTNLDDKGITLYLALVQQFTTNRLVIVSSNDKTEYSFCEEVLDINIYKNSRA